jgi:hypothetical protein
VIRKDRVAIADARTAVQKQQNRLLLVIRYNMNPLPDAVQIDLHLDVNHGLLPSNAPRVGRFFFRTKLYESVYTILIAIKDNMYKEVIP